MNLWTEQFKQEKLHSSNNLNFKSDTWGIFTQGTFLINDYWSVESGIRVDLTSDYGSFFLPRISFLYAPDATSSVRIGGGLGYKEPSTFNDETESVSYRNLLPLDLSLIHISEPTRPY